MSIRLHAVAAVGAVAVLAVPSGAAATVSVRITSIRVVTADTREPVRPPYRRERAYAYVVRYRIAGEALMRVVRRAEIRTPKGTLIARIAAPATVDEPGAYFATSRIPVGAGDPRTTYRLKYAVSVRGTRSGARDRAVRVLPLPFR